MSEDVKPYGAQVAPAAPTTEELRELIAQTGLSQRRAAEALDLDERTMRYYASGRNEIPRVVIYALRYLVSQEHGRANALVDLQVADDEPSPIGTGGFKSTVRTNLRRP